MARTDLTINVYVDPEDFRPDIQEFAALYRGGESLPTRVVDRVERLFSALPGSIVGGVTLVRRHDGYDGIAKFSPEFLAILAELRALRAE